MKMFLPVLGFLVLTLAPARALETKPNGFILNDQVGAFKQAKAENKLLMIEFFGIWCPPCNQLNEHVFSAPSFGKETDSFVKLKLDADVDASWELKEKYKIQGYPTVILATADGDEVGRIVGFRPLAEFLKEAKQAWKNREKPYAKLAKAATRGDLVAAAKLGLIEFDRGNYARAKKLLEQAKSKKYGEKIASSEISLLEEKGEADPKAPNPDLIAALEKSIREFPDSPESVDRRISLADKLDGPASVEKRRAALKDAIRVAGDLIAHPARMEGKDYMPPDLWVSIADANEKLGDLAAAKEAWKSAIRSYRAAMKSDDERGYSLELAYCLWKSGDVASAETIYKKFEGLYPAEFTFYHAHANMEFELGKYSDAFPIQEKAFEFSYGDNKLRAGYNLARILKAQGKKQEAIAIAEKTLREVKLPSDSSLRSHHSATRLRKMIDELKG